MVQPAARRHRQHRRAAAALLAAVAAALAGCGGGQPRRAAGEEREPRGVIVLAMGIPSDETIDTELTEALKDRLNASQRDFRLIHPRAQVQLQLFAEERLERDLRLRTAAGTAPDLLFINNTTATELHRAGLTRAVRMPASLLQRLDPVETRRVQAPDGKLTSLPVLLLPQLACFDRRRLAQSPTDLDALLRLSRRGLRVGLPLDGFNLAWTFGSVGVAQPVEELFAGQSATPERRAALGRWLLWLRRADDLPDLSFEVSQSQLIQELAKGELDWTSCRSTHLARLREELGVHLGVAPLPGGPGGPPTPISRQRVLAFGRNSSPDQQKVAEAFARFVLTPLTQRSLTLRRGEVLPVLGSERLPEGRKGTLRLLALAQAQVRARGMGRAMVQHGDLEAEAMGRVLSRYLYGDLDQAQAIEALVRVIQPEGSER
ncbi:MAG: extracellular solute-binding protein [Cyanobacteriota bacterium]|nr:extracellular solute-binding protein [Cyanobacteriota bacterium]